MIDFKINADNSFVKVQRVFDQNGILLDRRNNRHAEEVSIERFLSDFTIQPGSEEIKLRKQILQSRRHYLFIRYYSEDGECFPMEIRPTGLPIDDYDISFDRMTNKITRITNKSLRSEVRFSDMTQQEITGYVEGSTVDIWTQIDPTDQAFETLNILHIHVNDTSDEVTFDVAYMHDGEDLL